MKNLIRRFLGPLAAVAIIGSIIVSFFGFEIPDSVIYADMGLAFTFIVLHAISESLGPYILKRLAQTIFVIWLIASLTFILLRIIPGGPFDQEKALAPEVKAAIEAKYHLNDPLPKQYWTYITGVAQGHLGYSYKYIGREVSEIVGESFPISFQLGAFAMVLSFLVGIPLGVFAASRHNTWKDSAAMIGAISSVSLPSFLVAAIVITIFCFGLDWLPVALWDGPSYYILPVVVLGLRPAAIIARLTRSSVLEVIRSDYIRTARAKGLSETVILYKHVLKNSLIPVITFAGPMAAELLSGAFIIEHIFNIPGMGKHFIQSVSNRDYPLVLGVTLVFATLLVTANLIVDILYTYFDPRIKLS